MFEIGCGKGLASLVLANNLTENIAAIDNEPSAIDSLNKVLEDESLNGLVKVMCASMTKLPFDLKSFDLI